MGNESPSSDTPMTPQQTAGDIGAIVWNASRPTEVTYSDIKDIAKREKLREGFVAPMIDHLRSCGFKVDRSIGSVVITPPEDKPRTITLNEARERHQDALESGMRSVSDAVSSSDVFRS